VIRDEAGNRVCHPDVARETAAVTSTADLDALAARLAAIGCVAATEEAEALVATSTDEAWLEAAVERRARGEPLAWIRGVHRFGDLDLRVDPGVYVPRVDTVDLARRAAALLPPGGSAADLCTGAGAVAAHLRAAAPASVVVAADVDPVAVRCAVANGIAAVVGSLGSPFRTDRFDLVTCVAPYVPTDEVAFLAADVRRHEPRLALDGGPDGLDVVRATVVDAARLLRPGGALVVAVGGEQDRLLEPTLRDHGFGDVLPWWDDDGDLRGLVARR
jgi:release factor glutamine methyltransferase